MSPEKKECQTCGSPMAPRGKKPFIKNGIDHYFHASGCPAEKNGPHAKLYRRLKKTLGIKP